MPSLSEKILKMISILLNLVRLVLWLNMGSIPENASSAVEKNAYSAFGIGMFCIDLVSPSGLMCHSNPPFPSWLSVWRIYLLMEVVCCNSPVLLQDCQLFPLCLLIFFVSIFKCSSFGYINICNCYILLLDWSIYHYVVPFFISCYSLCSKVYLV